MPAQTGTLRLVDTVEEQAALDALIDGTGSHAPKLGHLHELLAWPFRRPPRETGSRFRGPGDPGVWYGALEVDTALAECGYWRWRFARAAGLEIPSTAQQVFSAGVAGRALRLDLPPLAARRTEWEHPSSYAATQDIARDARRDSIEVIVNRSVRDPEHRPTINLLAPAAFSKRTPARIDIWLLDVRAHGVIWQRPDAARPRSVAFSFTGSPATQGRSG